MSGKEQRFRIGLILALAGFVGGVIALILTNVYRYWFRRNHEFRLGDPQGSAAVYHEIVLDFQQVEISFLTIVTILSGASLGYIWWRMRSM